jgi:hypothetical protein
VDEPPPELFVNGFRRDTFDEWIQRLEAIRGLRSTCCFDCCCLTSIIVLPCFIPCFCAYGRKSIETWDKALRSWQDDFNNQILQHCGIYVKTQSRCVAVYVSTGQGVSKQRYTERWLAFALEPEEVAKLKAEAHVSGDIEDCGCCRGANESELCMHP